MFQVIAVSAVLILTAEVLGLRPFAAVGVALGWCSQRTPRWLDGFWVRFGSFVCSFIYTVFHRNRHPGKNPCRKWLDFHQMNITAHFEVNGSCQITNIVTLDPPVLPADVLKAALKLQVHHPVLRAALRREFGAKLKTPSPAMVYMDSEVGKAVKVLERVGPISEAVERELLEPLDPEGLGWRLGICGEHLLLTYHHCFMDGVSIMTVLQDLLRILDGQELALDVLEGKMAPPPRDDLPWYMPWALLPAHSTVSSAWKMQQPSWMPPLAKSVPWQERRMRHVGRTLTVAMTERLIERCRAEGTTISAALAAGVSRSLAATLGASSPMKCLVSVNVRPDCRRDVRTLGNYVGGLCTEVAPSQPFWEVARSHRAEVVQQMEQKQHLLLAVRPPFGYSLQLSAGKKKHPHADDDPGIGNMLAVSNRGAFQLATGSHRVRALHWVRQHQGDDDTDLLLLNAVSVDSLLCLTFCYKHPVVAEATIVDIADALLSELLVASGSGGTVTS